MAMKIVHSSWLPPKGFDAMTVLKWIVTRVGTVLPDYKIRHEEIHYAQEKELLYVFFYLLYGLEFAVKFLYYWDFEKTYFAVSFEREAYARQYDRNYIAERRHYAWLCYLYTKK